MFKILHTADWHIDAQPAFLQEKRDEYKKRRYRTAESIADQALREKVDAVVIAGDLFDRWEIRDAVLNHTIEILERFAPIPVYIIPGNHDPLIPDGVWDNRLWSTAGDNVHRCLAETEVELEKNTVLYPCCLLGKSSTEDPTDWIPTRDEGDARIRIGLAHGSIQHRPEYDEIPITPDRPTIAGLTYLALGHWHAPFTGGCAAYPGGIEPIRFGEPVGGFATVEFTDGLSRPQLEQRECGSFYWYNSEPEIGTSIDVQTLQDDIAGLIAKYNLILRIAPNVSRVTDSGILNELDRLRDDIHERAFFNAWTYDDYQRVVLTDPDSVPAGIIRTVWQHLEQMVDEGGAGVDPDVARAALVELQRITQQVKR